MSLTDLDPIWVFSALALLVLVLSWWPINPPALEESGEREQEIEHG
jgi:hypothetical protein